jgi:hypothetical protein
VLASTKISVKLKSGDVSLRSFVQESELFFILYEFVAVVPYSPDRLTHVAYLLKLHFFDDERHGNVDARSQHSIAARQQSEWKIQREIRLTSKSPQQN